MFSRSCHLVLESEGQKNSEEEFKTSETMTAEVMETSIPSGSPVNQFLWWCQVYAAILGTVFQKSCNFLMASNLLLVSVLTLLDHFNSSL